MYRIFNNNYYKERFFLMKFLQIVPHEYRQKKQTSIATNSMVVWEFVWIV